MEMVNRPMAEPHFKVAGTGDGFYQISLGALRGFGNIRALRQQGGQRG